MADNWTYWQRESAGQSDHGLTTVRMLAVFALVALVGILWLGPHDEAQTPPATSRPCAALAQHHQSVPAGRGGHAQCSPRRPGGAHR
jgi:hypothetical protein